MLKRAPISTILSEMLHAAGAEPLTLDWLLGRMGERSFGLVLLLLSVFGLLPGVSAFVAVLLMVPAIQMLLARSRPPFFLAFVVLHPPERDPTSNSRLMPSPSLCFHPAPPLSQKFSFPSLSSMM